MSLLLWLEKLFAQSKLSSTLKEGCTLSLILRDDPYESVFNAFL